MPEYEHPGVYVEEVGGKTKPIDGVATDDGDALTWADGPWFLRIVLIGGAILTCLGILAAVLGGDVIAGLIVMPGGLEVFGGLFVSAILLWVLRALVEQRRQRTGRPPLRIGSLILGMAVFRLAALVAANVGIVAFIGSLLIESPSTALLYAAGTNLLIGYLWITVTLSALRDILLLVDAVRDRPPDSAFLSSE